MLPILRILPVGGVLLAILLLILALNPPGSPRSQTSQSLVTARGALMERNHHPEWRQLLILAATRRANELNRLRELPDTPVRTAPDVPIAVEVTKEDDAKAVTKENVTKEASVSSANPAQDKRQDSSEDPTGPAKDSPVAPEVASRDPSQSSPQELIDQDPAQKPAPDSSQEAAKVAGLPGDQDSAAPDDATGLNAKASAASTLPLEIGEPSASELPVTKQEEAPPVITPARLKSRHQTRTRHVRVTRRVFRPLPKPAPFPPLFPFALFAPLNVDPMANAGTITPD